MKNPVFLGLRKFSDLNVLHKGLLMQDWVFRLGHFSVSIWPGSYFPENRVCKCPSYLHTAQFSLRHSTRVFAKHTSIQFSSSVLFSNSKQKKQGYPLPLSQLKSLKYVEQQLILYAPFQITDIFFLHTMSCMLRIIILGLEFPITHLYFSKGMQTIKRLSSKFWTPITGCPTNIVPIFFHSPPPGHKKIGQYWWDTLYFEKNCLLKVNLIRIELFDTLFKKLILFFHILKE